LKLAKFKNLPDSCYQTFVVQTLNVLKGLISLVTVYDVEYKWPATMIRALESPKKGSLVKIPDIFWALPLSLIANKQYK